ncbi:MAG: catalase [Chloroflexia bacterium]
MLDRGATDKAGTDWKEVFLGGSKEAEDETIRREFTPEINRIQSDIRRITEQSKIKRAQHSNMIAGTKDAHFEVLSDIPEDLQVGLFQPGKKYTAHVRLSNASSIEQGDSARDLRGAAVHVIDENGKNHDFLMTNAPFSHARDARQFMIISSAVVRQGHPAALWKLRAWRTVAGLVRIAKRLGLKEAMRILRTIKAQTSRPVASVATEQYWSRAPFAFGGVAVKFMLDPLAEAAEGTSPNLRAELVSRLRAGDVRFDFKVQKYLDAARTPIEDATVEWKEEDAPFITIARLVIPTQELDASSEADIDNYAFNPWNTGSDAYRPLGSMNRARKVVYAASAKLRTGS